MEPDNKGPPIRERSVTSPVACLSDSAGQLAGLLLRIGGRRRSNRRSTAITKEEWVSLAVDTVLALLGEEHAVVWSEVEAKLADAAHPAAGVTIDPHHLTSAKALLLGEDVITEVVERTRGGGPVSVYVLTAAEGRRKVTDAAARKRVLFARYMAWAAGRDATLGPAGEQVVHDSLAQAAQAGYRLATRSRDGVEALFGDTVPFGPLDDAAHLQTWTDDDEPAAHATVLVEVKNIREWVYPTTSELSQLLTKAALIQQEHPARPLLPVLVCRRANKTAFRAAKTLGFLIVDARRQYLLPRVALDRNEAGDRALLDEVRSELGFLDLVVTDGPDPIITKMLKDVVPKQVPQVPTTWAEVGSGFVEHYRALWQSSSGQEQASLSRDFRRDVRAAVGKAQLGW